MLTSDFVSVDLVFQGMSREHQEQHLADDITCTCRTELKSRSYCQCDTPPPVRPDKDCHSVTQQGTSTFKERFQVARLLQR